MKDIHEIQSSPDNHKRNGRASLEGNNLPYQEFLTAKALISFFMLILLISTFLESTSITTKGTTAPSAMMLGKTQVFGDKFGLIANRVPPNLATSVNMAKDFRYEPPLFTVLWTIKLLQGFKADRPMLRPETSISFQETTPGLVLVNVLRDDSDVPAPFSFWLTPGLFLLTCTPMGGQHVRTHGAVLHY